MTSLMSTRIIFFYLEYLLINKQCNTQYQLISLRGFKFESFGYYNVRGMRISNISPDIINKPQNRAWSIWVSSSDLNLSTVRRIVCIRRLEVLLSLTAVLATRIKSDWSIKFTYVGFTKACNWKICGEVY